MRRLSIIMTLGLGIMFAMPAEAEFRFSARIGSGIGKLTFQKGGGFENDRWRHRKPKRRSFRRSHAYPYNVSPYYRIYRDDRVETVPERQAPRVEPPVTVAPAEPLPPPPDPRGPLRLMARGGEPASAPYNVGEALPTGLPHVTLDWRRYDMPEPPPGRIYARVGRDVLLITAIGRVVEKILPPN